MSDTKKRIDIGNLSADAVEDLNVDDLRKVKGGATASRYIRTIQPNTGGNQVAIETLEIAHEGLSRG